jgi:Holliday junction resolvase RusA-like endonuclease
MYLPMNAEVKAWKRQIAAFVRREYPRSMGLIEGPLFVSLEFFLPRPTALQWKKKEGPALWSIGTPDKDNLEKAVYDAITGIVWKDDAQICRSTTEKRIAALHQVPGVYLTITTLQEEAWPRRKTRSK